MTANNDNLLAAGQALLSRLQTIIDTANGGTMPVGLATIQQEATGWQNAVQAAGINPMGQAGGPLPGAPWMPNTPYAVGNTVTAGQNMYSCVTAGTSAATGYGPMTTQGTIVDGTVRWNWAGPSADAQPFDPGQAGGGGSGGGGGGSDDGGGAGAGGGAGDDGGGPGDDGGQGDGLTAGGAPDPFADTPSGTSDEDRSMDDLDAALQEGQEAEMQEAPQSDDQGSSVMGADEKLEDNAEFADLLTNNASDYNAGFEAAAHREGYTGGGPEFDRGWRDGGFGGTSTAYNAGFLDGCQGHPHVGVTRDYNEGYLKGQVYAQEPEEVLGDSFAIYEGTPEFSDDDADPTRRRASVHRGSAYLQHETYPPFGTTEGQEGGIEMGPVEEVVFGAAEYAEGWKDAKDPTGEKLPEASEHYEAGWEDGVKDIVRETHELRSHNEKKLGSDYCHGLDILGAGVPAKKPVTPRKGYVLKTTPAGRKVTSLVVQSTKKHGDSIKNAKDAGKRAQDMAKKLNTLATKMASTTKAAIPKNVHPAVAHATAIHGIPAAISHAKKPIAKKLHQHLTPAKLKKIAARAAKVGGGTIKQADKHGAVVTAANNTLKKGTAAVSEKLKVGGKTSVHGDDMLGEELAMQSLVHGAEFDALTSDPFSEMDEMFGYTGPTDQDPSAVPTSSVAPTYAPDDGSDPYAVDTSALGAPPTQAPPMVEGVDFVKGSSPNSDSTSYSTLPLGAVIYDGSHPPLKWSLVSFNKYKNNEETFYSFPGVQGWGVASGGWDGPANEAGIKGISQGSSARDVNAASIAKGWGPLVGATDQPDFKGLRYNSGDDTWFWFWNDAPDYAKQPIMSLRLQKAITDYQAATAAAEAEAAAQAEQDALDQQQAEQAAIDQAAQDAADQKQAELDAAAQAKQDERDAAEQARQDARQDKADERAAAQQEKDDARDQPLIEKQMDHDLAKEDRQEANDMELLKMLAQMPDQASPAGTDEAQAQAQAHDGDGVAMPDVEPLDSGETGGAFDASSSDGPSDSSNNDGFETISGADRIRLRRAARDE